eukprot:SAG31_NODE_26380_length_443_cov_1.049419_1_plen_79_part_01
MCFHEEIGAGRKRPLHGARFYIYRMLTLPLRPWCSVVWSVWQVHQCPRNAEKTKVCSASRLISYVHACVFVLLDEYTLS